MPNMSYCEFENTARDLDSAIDKIESMIGNEDEIKEMSQYEARGLDELLANAKRLVDLEMQIEEILEDYYNGE